MKDDAKAPGRRGGKRPGAGRKKNVASATTIDPATARFLIDEVAPAEIETAAARQARLAIGSLVKRLLYGSNEAARVSAANKILDRGYGKPAVEIGGDAAMLPFVPRPSEPTVGDEMRTEARQYANLAIEVLRRIAEFGASESASVAAAASLLDRALGTVGLARVPDDLKQRPLGKKAADAKAAAAAGIGIFATPAAPKDPSVH